MCRGKGLALRSCLRGKATRPILIGTWRAASWAIRFYEKHAFTLVDRRQNDELLRRHWNIPVRQVAESVVLGHEPAAGERGLVGHACPRCPEVLYSFRL